MLNGIKAVVQVRFTNIHIERHNNILIQAVQRELQIPWEIQVLVQDITTYLSTFSNVIIDHIFRQDNTASDWVAKFGLSLHPRVWDVIPHRDIGRIIFKDNLGRALERMTS